MCGRLCRPFHWLPLPPAAHRARIPRRPMQSVPSTGQAHLFSPDRRTPVPAESAHRAVPSAKILEYLPIFGLPKVYVVACFDGSGKATIRVCGRSIAKVCQNRAAGCNLEAARMRKICRCQKRRQSRIRPGVGTMMNWLEESSYCEQDDAADINGRMDAFARGLGLEYFSYLVLSPPRNGRVRNRQNPQHQLPRRVDRAVHGATPISRSIRWPTWRSGCHGHFIGGRAVS